MYKVRFSKRSGGRNAALVPTAIAPEIKALDLDFVTWHTKAGPYFSLITVGRPFNQDLLVSFVDVGNRLVSVRFHETAAVSWQVVGECLAGERGDSCYEIIGSRWLAEHQNEWAMPELRHLKLNFTRGVLEAVCTAITTVSKRPLSVQDRELASHEPRDVLQRSLTVLEDVVTHDRALRPF